MNCGTKHKGEPMPTKAANPKNPKVSYPSFTLSDEKAAQFLKDSEAEVGDTLTGSVKLEVTGMRDDEYGKSVSLSVVELNDIAEAEAAEADEPDEKEDEKDAKPAKVNKAVRKMMKEA